MTEGVHLTIANSVTDLVQGDIKEHLPFERIPLQGDVLGLGTTTSTDNGELTFVYRPKSNTTGIFKCHANTGGIHEVCTGDGSDHFPYACYSSDASNHGVVIDVAALAANPDWQLVDWIKAAIDTLETPAAIYGLRVRCRWNQLVITVASKLCMGQRNRNSAAASDAAAGAAIYDTLQHYLLAPLDPKRPQSKIAYLGDALDWDCCGFFDTEPETGRVTVAQAGANLHIHGVSHDHRFGGHLHHEHSDTRLLAVDQLILYPINRITELGSDLAVQELTWDGAALHFTVCNLGTLDISDVGIDIVPDDSYSKRQYLRLPWLAAGASEVFSVPLELDTGSHSVLVAVDAVGDIIEPEPDRANNRAYINCVVE